LRDEQEGRGGGSDLANKSVWKIAVEVERRNGISAQQEIAGRPSQWPLPAFLSSGQFVLLTAGSSWSVRLPISSQLLLLAFIKTRKIS
jgi:hypothetical protein